MPMRNLRRGRKELYVVGDRVLIQPETGDARTKVGLLLPATAVEKESVQTGVVVAIGPGTPLGPADDDTEPWRHRSEGRFIPMQVEVGDEAVFFRKAAIEVSFEDEKFLVVPYSAILTLVRETKIPDGI